MQLLDDPLFLDWVLKTIRPLGFVGTRMDIGFAGKLVTTHAADRMDACQEVSGKKDLAKNRLESMTYADWLLFDSMETEKHAVH